MKSIALTDRESALAAQGKLTALVRVMKPQPEPGTDCPYHIGKGEEMRARVSPFGRVGSALAGKESWAKDPSSERPLVIWKAGCPVWEPPLIWRSPVTMPAWAVRHRFTVKAVRAMQTKDVTPGLLLETVSYDWESFYRRYGDENQWIWYCELEAI